MWLANVRCLVLQILVGYRLVPDRTGSCCWRAGAGAGREVGTVFLVETGRKKGELKGK